MNKVMLSFKHELLGHSAHIKKIAHLDGLEVVDHERGEFTLVAHWRGKKTEHKFTCQYVLGRNIFRPPREQTPVHRVCRFRDDFIRKVLHERGI